jgi:phenol 2-monooxygenase
VSKQDLATGINVGMRMPSFKVLNQADARPWHFQELLKSNGRWRLVIFAGNITNQSQHEKIKKLGESLGSPKSFLKRFTPANRSYDSVIEVLTVHSTPRQKTTIFDFPEVFRPWNDLDGWDYWKIFVDDESYHEGHGKAYENYGVDPEKGCAVILRPDQYVSFVGEVDDYEAMDHFFSGFMIPQKGAEKMEANGAA